MEFAEACWNKGLVETMCIVLPESRYIKRSTLELLSFRLEKSKVADDEIALICYAFKADVIIGFWFAVLVFVSTFTCGILCLVKI